MNATSLYTGMAAILIAAGSAGAAMPAPDAPPTCQFCGATVGLHRYCLPVRTTRPVKVIGWDVAQEVIAIPAELRHCDCRDPGCAPCGSGLCSLCRSGCHTAGKLRPRNRLLRKTYLVDEPAIVWMVHYVCSQCAAGAMLEAPASIAVEHPTAAGADSAWRHLVQKLCGLVSLGR